MISIYLNFAFLIGLTVGISSHPLEVAAVQQTANAIISSAGNDLIWDHLRANFKLKHYHAHPQVKKTAQRYLNTNYQLTTILERGAPYLHFIMQELEKRNLPAELVLLPLVESNYNPTARSHKNASGLWQLMPTTAQILGLEQNRAYDGRNDIYASTHAALDHLTYLNKKFKDDWLITLAAYNAGDGTLSRVIERNRAAGKPTDYWSLSIPYAETRNYVLRFLALVDIIENASEYAIKLPAIENRPALIYVQLQEKTDLTHAAKLTGISLQEIYAFNPGIQRNVTRSTPSGPYHLLLPAKNIQPQKIALLQKDSEDMLEFTEDTPEKRINYRVQPGDSLKKIAKANDTSIQQLLAWNDHIKDPDLLAPGELLNLYS